jgi:hypothetical protein
MPQDKLKGVSPFLHDLVVLLLDISQHDIGWERP